MLKYFLEIKNRFLLLLITWGSTVFTSYIYKKPLLFLLIKPNMSLISSTSIYFIYTNVTDIFLTYFQLILFIGNQFFIIYFFYHALIFFSPALYYIEYKYLKLVVSAGIIFWGLSIIILNKLLLPLSWQFFISFQAAADDQTVKLYFEAKITEYLNFYISLYYICNLNCQLFTALFVFFNYIKANIQIIKQLRKVFYFLFFFFVTLITPPDILSQLFLSLSIIFIFELLIVFNFFKTIFISYDTL